MKIIENSDTSITRNIVKGDYFQIYNDLFRECELLTYNVNMKGLQMAKNELLSEFEKWAKEVLDEYLKLLRASNPKADLEIIEFVLSIQEKYQKLAKGLRDIALNLYPSNPAIPYLDIMNTVLRPVLLRCINPEDGPKINETAYSQLLEEVKFLLELKLDSNRAWAFLHQFGCLHDYVELDGPIRIRRVTIIEKYYFELTNQSVGGRTSSEFVIETTSDIKFLKLDDTNKVHRENEDVLENFRTLITALRLTSPSSTGLNMISIVCYVDTENATIGLMENTPPLTQYNLAPEIFPGAFSPYVNTQCILDKHELELLQRIYKRLAEIKQKDGQLSERLEWALRRYNVALVSDKTEDSIVDVIIALEILFNAIGFRMAYRASFLASTSPDERKIAVEILEKSHKIRSNIVHGSVSEKEKQKKLLGMLILVVCRILRSYIHVSNKYEDVIDYIEDVAYNPEELSILENELTTWCQAETSWVWKPSESLSDLWET